MQVALALAGTGHAEHELPHVATSLLLTHALPQRWKPLLQLKPQLVPSHVAVAFAGAVHAVQLAPHDMGLLFERHWLPHMWKPVLQLKPQLVPSSRLYPPSPIEPRQFPPAV